MYMAFYCAGLIFCHTFDGEHSFLDGVVADVCCATGLSAMQLHSWE